MGSKLDGSKALSLWPEVRLCPDRKCRRRCRIWSGLV